MRAACHPALHRSPQQQSPPTTLPSSLPTHFAGESSLHPTRSNHSPSTAGTPTTLPSSLATHLAGEASHHDGDINALACLLGIGGGHHACRVQHGGRGRAGGQGRGQGVWRLGSAWSGHGSDASNSTMTLQQQSSS